MKGLKTHKQNAGENGKFVIYLGVLVSQRLDKSNNYFKFFQQNINIRNKQIQFLGFLELLSI